MPKSSRANSAHGACGRLEYPEAWAKIRVTGTILVLGTKKGGKEWIPSAVVLHAIPLSRMLK